MKPWYSGWPLALLACALAAGLYAAPDPALKWAALAGLAFLIAAVSATLTRLRRAELCKLRMDELVDEAKNCRDHGRLVVIEEESRIVLQSLRDIRREQLMADVERYSTKPAEKARSAFWDGFWSVFGLRSRQAAKHDGEATPTRKGTGI